MKLPVLVWLGDARKFQMNDRNDSTGFVLDHMNSLNHFDLKSLKKYFDK